MIIDFIIDLFRIVMAYAIRIAPIALQAFIVFALPPILFVIYRVFAAIKLREVAKMRGHVGKRFLILPLIFGLPGFIYIATLPDKKMQELKHAAQMSLILDREVVNATTQR